MVRTERRYYYPYLTTPEENTQPIGVWGRQHEQYLKENRQIVCNTLLLSGKLNAYLADISGPGAQETGGFYHGKSIRIY